MKMKLVPGLKVRVMNHSIGGANVVEGNATCIEKIKDNGDGTEDWEVSFFGERAIYRRRISPDDILP